MTTLLESYVDRKPVDGKNEHRVYFRVTSGAGNESSVRALDVDVATAMEQPYKLAELVAIKYLLMYSPYVGENRSGDGLKINVSYGAIKKVQKLHTTNSNMVIHGRFLQVRFSGAVIGTARRYDWVKDFSGDVVDISLKDCADKPVSTHVGELHLTRHAVERFKERLDIPNVDRAWKRLTKLMSNPYHFALIQ